MEYTYRTEPLPFQRTEFETTRDFPAWAHYFEQGLGKSKITIDEACWLYLRGLIDAVVVVAPNGVHRNWVEEEIPTHIVDALKDKFAAMAFDNDKSESKTYQRALSDLLKFDGMAWFTIPYESFTSKRGKAFLIDFFDRRRILYVLDEAHNIKTPGIARTESILMSSKYAAYKRLLTGTPISVGPFDMYTQMLFLDPEFWNRHRFSTFIEFRNFFGVLKKQWNPKAWNPKTRKRDGNNVDVVIGYKNLEVLRDMIKPLSSRLTKAESGLNLPAKRYVRAEFQMSPEQQELYTTMYKEFMVWVDLGTEEDPTACLSCHGSKEIEVEGYIYRCQDCCGEQTGDTLIAAPMAMVRLIRLQQITCGYLPTQDDDEPLYTIPGRNERLELLISLVRERIHRTKIIVWARFQLDIDLITARLTQEGITWARYDGKVDEEGRNLSKARFKGERPIFSGRTVVGRESIPEAEQAQVFVVNQAVGSSGLTLNVAKTAIYYNNNFKLIDRLQSEDRNHRIGQTDEVEYIDIVATGSVDEKIVKSMRIKRSISQVILGDEEKDWI